MALMIGSPPRTWEANPPVLHGPYWHWTRTVAGKTQSRSLTEEQAQRYQPWFDNARRLRELLTDLEERSLRAFLDAEDPAPKSPRYQPGDVRNVS